MKQELLKYYGVIESQEYVKEFDWMEKHFNQYIITIEDCDGTFLINREESLEQALIGGKIQFNLNEWGNQISKYKISGYKTSNENKLVKVKQNIKYKKIR